MAQQVYVPHCRKGIVALFTVSLWALSSCSDLDQITQFAKQSQEIGSAFPTIADEAQAACMRGNNFINAQNPLPSIGCEVYTSLKPSLVKVNTALFNYIASLGKLASADLSGTPAGFDKVAADLKQADPNISAANQGKATAAGALAKAITDLATRGYREHEVSKIIGQSDSAVQDVARFLSQYAADKYREGLQTEWEQEKSYFDVMKATSEPLATELLGRKCVADKARVNLRLKAVQEYQTAVLTIAATHRKLYEERDHLESKELAKVIGPALTSLGSAAVSMNKAF